MSVPTCARSERALMFELCAVLGSAIGLAIVLVVVVLDLAVHAAAGVPLGVGAMLAASLFAAAATLALVQADRNGAGLAARMDRRTGRGGRTMVVSAADGTRLHVEIDGPDDAEVTVVFAHGWMSDLTTWREQRRALRATEVRRVFYDQRGHGRSGWLGLRPEDGIRQLADDLRTVIEATCPSGRLVLAGHSMGGMALMAFAGRHGDVVGERVDGILLCATTASPLAETLTLGFPDEHERLRHLARRYAVPFARLLGSLPPRAAQVLGIGPFRLASGLLAVSADNRNLAEVATVGALYRTPLHVGSDCLRALMVHDERDSLDDLEPTRVTVVVPGRDRLVPPADQVAIAALAGGARIVTAPASGHMVMLESPALVNAELLALVLMTAHCPSDLLRSA